MCDITGAHPEPVWAGGNTVGWGDASPSHALEPTPITFAPVLLRLLARLTASVVWPDFVCSLVRGLECPTNARCKAVSGIPRL
jgi:hypothetical protein